MLLAWIALNSINGLGPVRIKNLIERFGSAQAVFDQTPEKIHAERIIPQTCATQLFSTQLFKDAQDQLDRSKSMGVEIMTLSDSDYPFYLKEIYAPPPILYIKGLRAVFKEHAVGIVGTRNPTSYGKSATSLITKELVEHRLVIVSGLARGIDTVAHETCLQRDGFTIAVLGNGIDCIYPKSNEKLSEQICGHGCLVSEFPLGTPPEAFNFPRRNRIISGLGAGVVVVEAGIRSGSLITAHYALQQGREIFAVPGPINSPVSIGTFNLIRDGATPARSGKEIAESLRIISYPQLLRPNNIYNVKLPLEVLSDDESKVYCFILDEPVSIDCLSEKSEFAIGTLLSILLNLELKGLINQISGQQFVRS
jgi:DNA processing protein